MLGVFAIAPLLIWSALLAVAATCSDVRAMIAHLGERVPPSRKLHSGRFRL